MSSNMAITSARFRNFKALKDYSISLRHMNILVGANNSGKSTALGVFRALAAGLRRAGSRSPEHLDMGSAGLHRGYRISADQIPISLENVRTDYKESESSVTFRLSNGDSLVLYFPEKGDAHFYVDPTGQKVPNTPAQFRQRFPIAIGTVPVLGPVEHNEDLLQPETVQGALNTHRASRHFRNYWHHFPDGFEEFRSLISETWPDIEICKPEVVESDKGHIVTLFCKENRLDRELFWVGSGFQIWCQLLTHILRSKAASLLVVDEPEIYLHPDLQRQLINRLRSLGPDVLLATHSSEIIGEAEPGDVLIMNKAWQSARHIKKVERMQDALDEIGSNQVITFTQLARSRRVLFIEGEDFKLLRRFAGQMNLSELANGIGITTVPNGINLTATPRC